MIRYLIAAMAFVVATTHCTAQHIAFSTKEDTSMANAYLAKADAFYLQFRFDSTQAYYKKALEIYDRVGIELDERAQAIKNFVSAELLAEKAQKDSAIILYKKAVKALENVAKQTNDPSLWEKVVLCYNRIGKYHPLNEKRKVYVEKAIEIGVKQFGEIHSGVGYAYNLLAGYYTRIGDHHTAVECYKKCMHIWKQTYGEDHLFVLKPYYFMSSQYRNMGELEKARVALETAMEIAHKYIGDKHWFMEQMYFNAGRIYKALGRHDVALAYFDKALALAEERKQVSVPWHYDQIGSIYRSEGESDKAIANYGQALSLWKKKFGPTSPFALTVDETMGWIYAEKSDHERALEHLNNVLATRTQLVGSKHPALWAPYATIADVFLDQKKLSQASSYNQKAIAALVEDFSDTNFYRNPPIEKVSNRGGLFFCLRQKAHIAEQRYHRESDDLNDLRLALSTLELASELLDQLFPDIKYEDPKLSMSRNTADLFDEALATLSTLYELTHDEEYLEKAFWFAEKGKAAVLSQSMQEARAKNFAGIPESILKRDTDFRMRMAHMETKLEKEKMKLKEFDSPSVIALQDEYLALKMDYGKFVEDLERSYPRYHQLKYAKEVALVGELRGALGSETAMIEYALTENTIYVFTLTSDDYRLTCIRRESSFNEALRDFPDSFKSVSNKASYVANAALLYEILIAPVAELVDKRLRLVIIPDDELFQIPFEALIVSRPQSSKVAYSDLDYVIKQHDISYHYSATLFLKTCQSPPKIDYEKDFVAFAPVFSDVAKNGTLPTVDADDLVLERVPSLQRRAYLVTRRGNSLDELKYSEQEVQLIDQMLRKAGQKTAIYIHTDASEDNFKRAAAHTKLVHLATHGFMNSDRPKLSNLAFSQPDIKDAAQDGILYSGETYNLNLNGDLVVLSACQSGAGKIAKGEGLISLTRGFLYSGARNIIASLWKVFDRHTSMLMVELYRQILDGKSYSAALRAAKLKMIANPETAGPQSWAAFVLIGR